jgi:hypothetical protein
MIWAACSFDAWYFCQVHTTDPMQLALQARRRGVERGAIFKLCQVLADAFIALGDFALSEAVGVQCHAQCEEQLLAPVAVQAFGHGLPRGFDASAAQCRQRLGIALSGQDRL